MTDNYFQKFKEEQKEVRRAASERMIVLISSALGLVAGIAWNNAVNAVIAYFLPSASDSVLAKILYAIVITVIVSVLVFYLSKIIKKGDQ